MSYFLNSKLCPEIAHHILQRDFSDVPVDSLPEDWLAKAISTHLISVFFPKASELTDEESLLLLDEHSEDEIPSELSVIDPDEELTKMLLGDISGTIYDIEITSAPYRIIHLDDGVAIFPVILIKSGVL